MNRRDFAGLAALIATNRDNAKSAMLGDAARSAPLAAPSAATLPPRTLIWVPPSLCSQLRITAQWVDDIPEGGTSYRHPKAGTIEKIEIVSVSKAYERWTREMPDMSWFITLPEPQSVEAKLARKYNLELKPRQTRGYLRYPIENPTPAECLYTFLTMHRGQTSGCWCGCQAFQHFDEKNGVDNPNAKPIHRHHPIHTRKCRYHVGDDMEMTQAISDQNEILLQKGT